MCKINIKYFLSLVSDTRCEENVAIGKFNRIANSYIGYASYIGDDCKFVRTKIGKFCSIGSNVKIIFGSHPTSTYVSTHPAFYSVNPPTCKGFVKKNIYDEYKYVDDQKKYYVSIGNDVWIGDGVKIMQGIKIEDGAILAAGSIVTKNVGPYEIVAGVPARVIKRRFSQTEIDYLLRLKWWEKSPEWLKKNANLFDSIHKFKEVF